MGRDRYLSKAPIREALIDIQFQRPIGLDLIDDFAESIRTATTAKHDIWAAVFGVSTGVKGDLPQASTSQSVIGRRLDLKKGPFILQCRENGFTLSRLAPYKDWNDLRTEANLLWRQFRQRFASVPVSRIAVRYINEIKLPLPIVDFDEYLTAAPKSPTGVPQAFSQFLTRVMIPDEEKKCVSVISHVMEAPPEETPNGSSVTLLLDIDVFREILPPIVDDDRLWDGIDELRLQKNRMFFAHLTDKALELFA